MTELAAFWRRRMVEGGSEDVNVVPVKVNDKQNSKHEAKTRREHEEGRHHGTKKGNNARRHVAGTDQSIRDATGQTRAKKGTSQKVQAPQCGKIARAQASDWVPRRTDKSRMKRTGNCGRVRRAGSDRVRVSRVPIRKGQVQSMRTCVSPLSQESHVHCQSSNRYEQRIFENRDVLDPYLVPFQLLNRKKMSAMFEPMFEGEEDFVLPAQPASAMPVPPGEPFVHIGWEEAADHPAPPRPLATPSPEWLRKRALRTRIQQAEAARQKAPAPRIGRWLQSLQKLPQHCFEAVRGGFQWVKSMVGGKRKLVEVEGSDAESNVPTKRARLEIANEASAEVEVHQEGQVPDEAVHRFIELPDFRDIGYGVDEDQAATEVILGADDEFNAQPIEPEAQAEPIAEEEPMEVDVEEVAEVVEVVEVDAAGNGDAIAPVPEVIVVVPPAPANDMPQPAAPRRRYGPRDPRQFAIIQKALGRGFEVQLLANGTVKLVGILPGFDQSSPIYRKAASGGYIITAPFRSRFTHVAAGSEHAMLLTSKNRLMTLGSNIGGQLGTRRLIGLARVASQTLGSIERGPIGTAKVKFVSIMARGTESWAWDKDGFAYYCGTANDGSWRSAVFKKVEEEEEEEE